MKLLKDLFLKPNDAEKSRRTPLFIRISFPLVAFVLLLTLLFGSIYFKDYQESLYSAEFEKGWLSLTHLNTAARSLLLKDDLLQLNYLVADFAKEEMVVFASVIDHQQNVLAHSDNKKVGSKYVSVGKKIVDNRHPDFSLYRYELDGDPLYELSQSIQFQDKVLGTAILGISQHYIDAYVEQHKRSLLNSLYLPLLALLLSILGLAVALTLWAKFILFKVRTALHELCRGSGDFQVDISGNNELNDLVSEVKQLSSNLQQKERMQTDIANYLKSTTLERILDYPRKNGSSNASRRQVTVLYAGVAGFGEYASHTKAEVVVEALNEYIGIATKTILAHGGYVDKLLGDAVVGIFGVSVFREDHTRRAVRAAWEMQSVLREHDKGDNQILAKVRIGMSSGVVLSGNIGSVSRVEYSSIGESIKEAFWLNGLAEEREIVISKGIYQIIKDIAYAEPLTPQKLIGHEGVLESYRLQRFEDPLMEALR